MIKVKSNVRAGGIWVKNHVRKGLKVKVKVKAGGFSPGSNHSRSILGL